MWQRLAQMFPHSKYSGFAGCQLTVLNQIKIKRWTCPCTYREYTSSVGLSTWLPKSKQGWGNGCELRNQVLLEISVHIFHIYSVILCWYLLMHVLATAPAVHLFLTFSVKSGLETYTTKSTAEIECSDCLKLKN